MELHSPGLEGHGHSNCLPCAVAAHSCDFACVIGLLAPAEAQHGGGGGHSGGGHSGGGHSAGKPSGGSHAGGHFGWLHFWSGKHSARHAGFGASSTSDPSPHPPSHLWNPTPARMPSIPRIPSTLLWSPPLFPRRPDGNVSCAIQSLFRFDVDFVGSLRSSDDDLRTLR